jgi:hypothetical protein
VHRLRLRRRPDPHRRRLQRPHPHPCRRYRAQPCARCRPRARPRARTQPYAPRWHRARPRPRASARPCACPRSRAGRPWRPALRHRRSRRLGAGHEPGAHGAGGARHPGTQQRPCRTQPRRTGAARRVGAEPRLQPRLRQDQPAGAQHPATGRPPAGGRDRRRPADQPRRRPHSRHRRTGTADQHRQGLPPGRGDGGNGHRTPGTCARFGADDRKRRQSGLPLGLRPGRGAQGRGAVGDGGRGQAAQVPGHVPCRFADAAEQGRPVALPAVRRRRLPGQRPAHQPADPHHHGVGHHGEGMDEWLAWIEEGVRAARGRRLDEVGRLQRRVAELEAQLRQRPAT